jgi:hypothetical protein
LDVWRSCPDASPFQHPVWLETWWDCFAGSEISGPHVFAGRRSADRQLECVAGWAIERRRFTGLELRRLQLLGQSTWVPDASPGEIAALLQGPSDARASQTVIERALDVAMSLEWDDFRVSYAPDGSAFARAVSAWAARHGLRLLRRAEHPASRVATDGDEARYWASRSANERRATLGKRRLAASLGVEYSSGGRADSASLRTLFALHERRWHGKGLAPRQHRFLLLLAERWTEDVTMRVSVLRAGGDTISASLNLDSRGVVYNLQGGFVPEWDRRLSLGKLHLGHEISAAFSDPDIVALDLLPGTGMKTDYKAGLATCRTAAHTLWVLRSRRASILQRLGAVRDRWRTSEESGWTENKGS